MDRERWERIQAVFHQVVDLPARERQERLQALCGGDTNVLAEVTRLLEEDARGDSLLHRELADVASDALAGEGWTATPRQLGPYRLRELLGEGGMGVVYLAERTDLHSLVAIKILRDAWISPARRDRFATEQRTLAQLNHPCIARLYDADTLADGTPWFAMEFVDGVPLTTYCGAHACTVRERLELFRDVCEAVLHAHQHAVIHRDLKPTNILVTRGGQPKLLDFGIAKPLDRVGSDADRTRTELRLMTPAYAAPEQFRGEGLGVHTDVYSLGVVLYELLSGGLPFDLKDRSPVEADRIVAQQSAEKPSARRNRVHSAASPPDRGAAWADLDVLCLTAMHKDPARRYPSVESLIRDVDHYLRGEPLDARADTPGYRLGKFSRRHWRPLTVATATFLAVVGLVTFYTLRLAAARNAALDEAARTRRIQELMTQLFEGGDPGAGPSDSLRVVTLLGRGVEEARALRSEPAVQAELYQTLGGSYGKLGDFVRADTLLSEALAIRRAQLGAGHPDVARSLTALGLLRSDESRYDEAEKLVREGLGMARRRARQDPAAVARATTALGLVLENRGDNEQAIEVLTQAVRLDSLAGLPATDVSASLTELANSYFYAGRYAIADSLDRRLLSLDRGLYGERHPHVASDLVNLGAIQQEWGRYPEAERFFRQALDIYRGWYGENHYETAATMNMTARILIWEHRNDEARSLLGQALSIRERVFGPEHPMVASTLNELGRLAQVEGRLDEAVADFRRMADIYIRAYQGKHQLIGVALGNLGGVYTDRKQYAVAEGLFHQALAQYAVTLPPDHLYVGIMRLKLGRALLRSGRYREATHETLAGYDIVTHQKEPAATWTENACKDLVAEYQALGRPDSASRFQGELERSVKAAASAGTH